MPVRVTRVDDPGSRRVVGFGRLAVAAAIGWRSAAAVLPPWPLLLIAFALAVGIAGVWIRMLAYSAVVFVPIGAQHRWSTRGAAVTLSATALSSIGVQKMRAAEPKCSRAPRS